MLGWVICSVLLVVPALGNPVLYATDEELRTISEQIWAADANRLADSDVVYDKNGQKFFTFVNEAALTGTYANMIALFNNYEAFTGTAESCGQTCRDEENVFLDAILNTGPIQLAHDWLVTQGLATASVADFKEDLRQYWFMLYTRSGGPLDSSGFEHTYVGEIDEGEVKGFHNWVQFYFEEKAGNLIYNGPIRSCQPTIETVTFDWLAHNKPISGGFIRTSPEVEIALSTICLVARTGNNCPIRLQGIQLTMTAWDMTGLPKTIGSTYPNC
jgi:poly(U)-specific endoribonuclease